MPHGSVDPETKERIRLGMKRYWERRRRMGKEAELYDRLTRAALCRTQRVADREARKQ